MARNSHPSIPETFATTQVYFSVSLSDGSFLESTFAVTPAPGAEEVLGETCDVDPAAFLAHLLRLVQSEYAPASEQCGLTDRQAADSLRLLRDALGEAGGP